MIGTVLEMLGIGLVIPALALMTTPDIAARYPALSPWLAKLGNPNQAHLVMGGMLGLVAIYTVKSGFFAFLVWRRAQFVFGVEHGRTDLGRVTDKRTCNGANRGFASRVSRDSETGLGLRPFRIVVSIRPG